jgi:hypothetical protein
MKLFTSYIGILVLCVAFPALAEAARPSEGVAPETVAILERIVSLKQEVVRLQALLAERSQLPLLTAQQPYQSLLFTVPMETYYFVEGTMLVPAPGTKAHPSDQVLWDLFVETIGPDAVKKYVAEWRVFNNDEVGVDAYVESIGSTGRYVMSINRSGLSEGRSTVVDHSYRKLFIHEYAHMLFFAEPDVTTTFTELFWTPADLAHKEQFATAVGDRRVRLLAQYYERNPYRFVSDYATISPEEDMAETFLYSVVEPEVFVSTGLVRDKQIFIRKTLRVRAELARLKELYWGS